MAAEVAPKVRLEGILAFVSTRVIIQHNGHSFRARGKDHSAFLCETENSFDKIRELFSWIKVGGNEFHGKW